MFFYIFRSLLFAERKGVWAIKLCVMSFIVGHAVSAGQDRGCLKQNALKMSAEVSVTVAHKGTARQKRY